LRDARDLPGVAAPLAPCAATLCCQASKSGRIEGNSMKKENRDWFCKGFDPRRHVLSRAERQKGYWVATRFARMPSRVRAWLRSKIRRHYQEQRKAG
jgi:hypothetical protein